MEEKNGEKSDNLIQIKKKSSVYIPPFKLKEFYTSLIQVKNHNDQDYQMMMWEMLKKSINGIVNKVNISNIKEVSLELFNENLFRGRGLLVKAIMKSQQASLQYTNVYACLVGIINSKFPDIGRILVNRYIVMFQKNYKRNNKLQIQTSLEMIAHLINQQVISDVIGFEILLILLENSTSDSIELCVSFLKSSGEALEKLNPNLTQEIFEKLREILHEGSIDRKAQYLIDSLFAIRKSNYKNFPSIIKELDIIDDDDKIIHFVSIQNEIKNGLDYMSDEYNKKFLDMIDFDKTLEGGFDNLGTEEYLDNFHFDPNYEKNEESWNLIKTEILGDNIQFGDNNFNVEDDEKDDGEMEEKEVKIIDMAEKDLISLKKTVYLNIVGSLNFDECCHKLLKLNLKEGQELEVIGVILEANMQSHIYEKYFSSIAERLCLVSSIYKEGFESQFKIQFLKLYNYETKKIINLAYLYSHLLSSKAIELSVLQIIDLTEESTTTASRIFIKYLFIEMTKLIGINDLLDMIKNEINSKYFKRIMIMGDPKETIFCINYFTSIGLGALTEDMRNYLTNFQSLVDQSNEKTNENIEYRSSSPSNLSSTSLDKHDRKDLKHNNKRNIVVRSRENSMSSHSNKRHYNKGKDDKIYTKSVKER